jgi:N-acyl-L-amino-acid amidohydrolase
MKTLLPADVAMIDLLKRYIQIRTVYPNPDYTAAIALLRSQATGDGLVSHEITLASGFSVLVIELRGTNPDLPVLVLNHHMDVVPAGDENVWEFPPFEGHVHNGHVTGRGTQDMKGVGVVHYSALKALKDAGVVPDRTIYLFAVPDEERGGFLGTQLFMQTAFFKALNIGFIFDEGCPSGDVNFLYNKVTERKVLQLRITSAGTLAHGSQLLADNALHTLISFLAVLVDAQRIAQLQAKDIAVGQLLSMNITSLCAGQYQDGHVALNVIPGSAQATIDIRVPPSRMLCDVLGYIENIGKQYGAITIDVLARSQEEPQSVRVPDASVWQDVIGEVVRLHGIQLKSLYFEATTDMRYYTLAGIPGAGLTPFRTKNNIHGLNEAVPIDDLIMGRDIIIDILKKTCCIGRQV